MNPWLLLSIGCIAIILALWIPGLRLKRAVNAPFPPDWVSILEANVEVYCRLPSPLRTQLHRLIQQFLYQKYFTGAAGLTITDEIRVTIAAEACMLVLNRPSNVFPGLRYIIVYPTSFFVQRNRQDEAGVVELATHNLLGESWHNGKVILAWDSVMSSYSRFSRITTALIPLTGRGIEQQWIERGQASKMPGHRAYRIRNRRSSHKTLDKCTMNSCLT